MTKCFKHIPLLLCAALFACTPRVEEPSDPGSARELTGVRATIDGAETTRASVTYLKKGIGRTEFVKQDSMVLTHIARTESRLDNFTYTNIGFRCEGEGVWNRTSDVPEKIYWSDAANPHTFIGYSLPRRSDFVWTHTAAETATSYATYGGQLNTTTLTVDGTSKTIVDHTDSAKIVGDDLLLTEDRNMQAETGGSVALIHFHHALACVRVIVNINGFASSAGSADAKSRVSDMVLRDMYTHYDWTQTSAGAMHTDGTNTNMTADTRLWIPSPDGESDGVGRTFTFYALAVPLRAKRQNLGFSFRVTYPDPMNPDTTTTRDYSATVPEVEFHAGYCTTIHISLNHQNEHMTVGAEYMEWQYVETPDQGNLRKNSTFLTTTSRDSITIVGDAGATIDDATWLYRTDKTDADSVLDIYGNNGTSARPYRISTANQLLSFAYEVKAGRTFTLQYIDLDADITMQKSVSGTDVTWVGIGDDTHAFNGIFLCENRNITYLKGSPLFFSLGSFAVIDKLNFSHIIEIQGEGTIANINRGLICGCNIEGPVVSTVGNYAGSIVGENLNGGFILGCTHVGEITGNNYVGGVVGYNDGVVIATYHSGTATTLHTDKSRQHAAIGAYSQSSLVESSFYNNDYNYSNRGFICGRTCAPASTRTIQSNDFVNKTDGPIITDTDTTDPDDNPSYASYYSLNHALYESFIRLKNQSGTEPMTYGPRTFTPEQVQFFKAHYHVDDIPGTDEAAELPNMHHRFVYKPGEYPKLQ